MVFDAREKILSTKSELSSIHGVMNTLPENITPKNIENYIIKAKELFKAHPPHTIIHLAEEPLAPDVTFLNFPFSYISNEQKIALAKNNQISKSRERLSISTQVAIACTIAALGVGIALLIKHKDVFH